MIGNPISFSTTRENIFAKICTLSPLPFPLFHSHPNVPLMNEKRQLINLDNNCELATTKQDSVGDPLHGINCLSIFGC